MKYSASASLAFAVGASAASIKRDTCSYNLTASGGQSGLVGQLDDGQLRILGNHPTATFTINNGETTDSKGRPCYLTSEASQYQCDTGMSATGGFAIGADGTYSHSGSSVFYACPSSDNDYNIYTAPVTGQDKCVKVGLTASGCFAPSSSSSSARLSTSTSQQASSSTLVSSTKASSSAPVSESSKASVVTATTTQQQTCAASTVTVAQTVVVTQTPSAKTIYMTSTAPGQTIEETQTQQNTAPAQTVVVTQTQQQTCAAPSTVTVTQVQSAAGQTVHETQTQQETAPAQTVVVTQTQQQTCAAPSTVTVTQVQSAAPSTITVTQVQSMTAVSTEQVTATESVKASSAPATSSQAQATTSAVSTPKASFSFQILPYQPRWHLLFPNLIVPVSSASPDKSYGTSYDGVVNSTVSSLFNFDIPSSYASKTCSLVFLFPTQDMLETSSYTFSGSGAVDFKQLSTTVTTSSTYNSIGSTATDFGSKTITPGSWTVVNTFACPAGQAISYEMTAGGSNTDLWWFEDYNPSPIGLFITTC
ncbi:gpi anchored cell wall [Botrytis cinerea]